MAWIIVATILNTVWTLWCVQLLPPRVATHFALGGQPDGWMSRKGYAWFSILFPLVLSAFIAFVGGLTQDQVDMTTQMQHLAAALIIFFSFLTWCMVRSNRKTPARIDYPSLILSVAALLLFTTFWVGGLPKGANQRNQAELHQRPQ